jgi:hypothetical protein
VGIQIKSCARLGMSKQALNCLYVFAFVDKEGCEAVAKVMEAESLSTLKPDADPNRGWENFILCHHVPSCWRSAAFCPSSLWNGKTQSSAFA